VRITKDDAWLATYVGAACLAVTGFAYGRGWKKWVEVASIGSIALPASAWFAHYFWGQESDPSKMTMAELKDFAKDYKGEWTDFPELVPAKDQRAIIRHLLTFDNANEIVEAIGVDVVWPHVEDRFNWCVYCYDKVDALKDASEGVIRDGYGDLMKAAFDEEGELKPGYDFRSRTLRVLEGLQLLTADLCSHLRYDVRQSEKINRVACAVAYNRLCENEDVKALLIEELGVLTDREKKTLAKKIEADPQLLLVICEVNPNLLRTVEGTAFEKCPEAIAYALQDVQSSDQDRPVVQKLCEKEFFEKMEKHLPYELTGWKAAMRKVKLPSTEHLSDKQKGILGLDGVKDSTKRLEELHACFEKGESPKFTEDLTEEDREGILSLRERHGLNMAYGNAVDEALKQP